MVVWRRGAQQQCKTTPHTQSQQFITIVLHLLNHKLKCFAFVSLFVCVNVCFTNFFLINFNHLTIGNKSIEAIKIIFMWIIPLQNLCRFAFFFWLISGLSECYFGGFTHRNHFILWTTHTHTRRMIETMTFSWWKWFLTWFKFQLKQFIIIYLLVEISKRLRNHKCFVCLLVCLFVVWACFSFFLSFFHYIMWWHIALCDFSLWLLPCSHLHNYF